MPLDPNKGYRSLLRGRHSVVGAEYFITFCTESRRAGLAAEPVATRILAENCCMVAEGVWIARCAVIMPDHVHLLVRLGDRLALGRAVARLKSKSTAALNAFGLAWQDGYHEHRLRRHDSPLPLFLYVYLNPYRAGLLSVEASWPWFLCGESDRQWFMPMLDKGLPEPTWLADLP